MSQVAPILLAFAPYVVPIIITLLVPVVQHFIAQLPANKREMAAQITRSVVSAVEQSASDQLNGPGKKQLALEMVQTELKHFGVNVPVTTVSALIEESVLALNIAQNSASMTVTQIPMSSPPAPEGAHA